MIKRTSKVDSIKLDSAGIASVFHIGDSTGINSFTRTIAVQREKELFYSNEGNFDAYEIFSLSLPLPPIDEPITIHTTSLNSFIKVGSIDILAISAASVLHIGSSEHIQMETRTLQIRQLEPREHTHNQASEED
jgi:spore germination protein PE